MKMDFQIFWLADRSFDSIIVWINKNKAMDAILFVFVNFQYVMDWAVNDCFVRNWYISHQKKIQ